MEIKTINGHTRTLGAPADWDQSKGECVGLPIMDQETENGPCMISEWQPEADDIKLLNMGMPIHLWVYGDSHPVVSVSVGQPTQEAIDNPAVQTHMTNALLHGCAFKGWQCFHCSEIFETVGAARDHFGADPSKEPGCLIKVKYGDERGLEMELRKTEAERDTLQYQISNESTEADLKIQSMQADHQIALRREEEKGYARGLADGRTTVEIQDPWEPIETAIEFDEIIVTGHCFGEPEKGRFYSKAKRYEDKFYCTNEHGEEEEIGYLTHWIYTPESHYVKTFSRATQASKSIRKLTMTLHTNTAHLRKTITDLIACDAYAVTFQTMAQYRTGLMKEIEKALAYNINIDNDVSLMPRSLTAENGAKAALMGEFHETIEFSCRECDEDDEECEFCNGTGQLLQKVPVDWTTIKAIYAKAVEVCEVKNLP